MVRFWTCLKGKPIGFADTEHGCERRAQGIWPHHQQEGAAWNRERGEERRERREEEGKESSLEDSEVFLLTRGGLAGWRKETEWVSSPTGGAYTVCQVKAGNGSFKEAGVPNVWHSALKDGEGTGKPRREHPGNHAGRGAEQGTALTHRRDHHCLH